MQGQIFRYAVMGNGLLVILNAVTWAMPILVYVLAVSSEIPDFIFELMNSLQVIFNFDH